jgi:hypothetical protein
MKHITDRLLALFLLFILIAGHWGRFDLSPGLSVYLFDLAMVLVAIRIVFDRTTRNNLPTKPFFFPLLSFLGILGISLAVNLWRLTPYQAGHSSLYLVRLILYAVTYFWASDTLARISWLKFLAVFGTAISLLGLLLLLLMPDQRLLSYLGYDPHYHRLVSSYLDPNFSGLIIVLTLILLSVYPGFSAQPWRILFLGINFTALILTYSRSSYLALIVAAVIYSVMRRRFLAPVFLVLVIAVFAMIPKENYISLDLFRIETLVARWGNLLSGWRYFLSAPLFGLGFNTLRFTVAPKESLVTIIPSRALSGFDNSFIFLLVTSGVMGLFFYIKLVIAVFQSVIVKHKRKGPEGALIIPTFGALFCHALAVNSLFYPPVFLWTMILLGWCSRKD